jgi:glycogen debranching enzyme
MALTILEGSTFCICDERGDLSAPTHGLYMSDTRFLSRFGLTLNGATPLLLSSGRVEYFSAAIYLRNPLAGDLEHDQLAITRERFVGEGMQERIVLQNLTGQSIVVDVALETGNDFADIFAVKHHDFALGDPARAEPLPPLAPAEADLATGQLVLFDEGVSDATTQLVFSHLGEVDGGTVRWGVTLGPHERWDVRVDVVASLDGMRLAPEVAGRRFGEELARVRDSLAAWQLRVPHLRATWEDLGQSFSRSVADLAALRMRGAQHGMAKLPAAGMPWFMTVFGRDTIITCLQTLLFGPDLARGALEALAELQATKDDPRIDAEPGKIVHELRRGKAALNWFNAYYGTVDATPLYLILLSETWRWTDDSALVRSLREPAMRALEWIDRYGDRDGDGFVEYERRTPTGLENQSWKDSWDSQRFSDGTLARTPIAPCEVQGYVYDAKLRMAELARQVWRERELAERLEREAEELHERFDEAFWVPERGGYYALALDGDKQPVDSLCSNIGHLLWSGIVPPGRVDAIADALLGDELWSGWGVRTMSSGDVGFNPISYHNGSVWPHDNSLIAAGLAREGRRDEALQIVQRIIGVGRQFDHQLPEVFAGFRRDETSFPIAYPTAARPQAWAAGTPVLLLQVLLGLEPDRARQTLVSRVQSELPSWAGSLRLAGVQAFGRHWTVVVDQGRVRVEET